MGTFDLSTFTSIRDIYADLFPGGISLAIETGTCLGYSTRILAKEFKEVFTIELSEELTERTRKEFVQEGFSNIRSLCGDSGEVLNGLLRISPEPENTLFYLDAHFSGNEQTPWQTSDWKGYGVSTAHLGTRPIPTSEEQVPLLREFEAIAKYCKGPAFLYIDDYGMFDEKGRGLKDKGFVGNDWSHLHVSALKEACGSRLRAWIPLPAREQLMVLLKAKQEG